jgi:hypothetical protein
VFYEIHGLRREQGLIGTEVPVVLSMPVRRWFNVWHQLDPLAYVVGRIIQIKMPGESEAQKVQDLRLDIAEIPTSKADCDFHSSYWTDRRFLAWAANTLSA